MAQDDVLSDPVRDAMRIALEAGNRLTVISSDWKPRQVVFMDRPISPTTKAEIQSAHPQLEHFASDPTPHNPATEGFIDHEADMVLSFPAHGEQRRWYPTVP
jgi:hypothetical protein